MKTMAYTTIKTQDIKWSQEHGKRSSEKVNRRIFLPLSGFRSPLCPMLYAHYHLTI